MTNNELISAICSDLTIVNEAKRDSSKVRMAKTRLGIMLIAAKARGLAIPQ